MPWHEHLESFRCLATELGQRDAGAFARLLASCDGNLVKRPSRFIGATGEKLWRAALDRSGLFRLPGEDAQVSREKRKFGEAGKPLVVHRSPGAKPDDTRQSNFFVDYAGLASLAEELGKRDREKAWLAKEWTSAEVTGETGMPSPVHGRSFWGCVKAAQWQRIQKINKDRITRWKEKLDRMPD